MTRLVEALKKVGQTFELFQRGEIGPCESTPSSVQILNLVPSSYCQIPVEEPPAVIDPSDSELQIAPDDEKIDVRAKFALKRMVNRIDRPDMQRDAARLILGLKGKRLDRTPGKRLEGIFGDDLGKAVEVARDHGTERWLLVPKEEDAALVLVNEGDPLNDPPTVIFRGDTPDISKEPGRLDEALQKASTTFEWFQQGKLGPCASSPSAIRVPNLVPSSFCRLEWVAMWEDPTSPAGMGQKRKMILEGPGLHPGQEIIFEVTEEVDGVPCPVDPPLVVRSLSQVGRAEAIFDDWHDDGRVTKEVTLAEGGHFPVVRYRFVVRGAGRSVEAEQLLNYSDSLNIRFEYEDTGEPVRGAYTLHTPWGSMEGETDNDGCAYVQNLPPGGAEVVFKMTDDS